jgi:hypothetical protein
MSWQTLTHYIIAAQLKSLKQKKQLNITKQEQGRGGYCFLLKPKSYAAIY